MKDNDVLESEFNNSAKRAHILWPVYKYTLFEVTASIPNVESEKLKFKKIELEKFLLLDFFNRIFKKWWWKILISKY